MTIMLKVMIGLRIVNSTYNVEMFQLKMCTLFVNRSLIKNNLTLY